MFPYVVNVRKKREAAINMAMNYYDGLLHEINKFSNKIDPNYSFNNEENNKNIILNQPINYFKNIFLSDNYRMFAKYGFVAKKYQKILDKLTSITISVILAISIILYFIFHSIPVSIIVCIVLVIISIFAINHLTKGKSYNEFYKETVYGLIFKIIPSLTVTNGGTINLNSDILKQLIKLDFDRYKISNNLTFKSDYLDGELYNLKIEKDREIKNQDGTIRKETSNIFDGFSITLNYKNSFNTLKGAIIQIRDDDNAVSALVEDTVQGIYQSDKEFMFNSEELNKAFDCYIRGTNSFGDIDDLMMNIHKVITPTFEEQLLFLRKRYNTFNMTITDNMINFNVNMSKSTYQKIKNGEFASLKTKYRDYIKNFSLPLPNSSGAKDFMYYKMFPPAEKLFFILYFDNFIKTYLDRSNIKIENIDLIKSFHISDLQIADMDYSEFKKEYKDVIEDIYDASKNTKI